MFQIWKSLGSQLNVQVRRCSSKSALFITGREGSKKYAVFSPDTEFGWVKEHRETLEKVYALRGITLDINAMVKELESYVQMKREVDDMSKTRDIIQQQIKENKTKGGSLNVVLLNRLKENKKSVRQMKELMWDYEESLVLNLLKLQNCDSKSTLDKKLYMTQTKGYAYDGQDFVRKGHKELAMLNDLVEFSTNSHTSFYLKHHMAMLELKLNKYLASKFLSHNFEAFSNPDFSKSVMIEGCGEDFLDYSSTFNLKKFQDFGDRASCNAMHLVGGASLAPFVAYFAKNILLNPQILPLTGFCLGRSYSPQPRTVCDLFNTQQSQAAQLFSVSSTQLQMEEQLELLLNCMVEVLSVFPNFTITEQSLDNCDVSNSRQFSVTMQGVETVEVGQVAVQGSYFSRRMMMVGKENESNTYFPLHTVSGSLNLTKILGVVLEMVQDKHGGVDCDKIGEWLK